MRCIFSLHKFSLLLFQPIKRNFFYKLGIFFLLTILTFKSLAGNVSSGGTFLESVEAQAYQPSIVNRSIGESKNQEPQVPDIPLDVLRQIYSFLPSSDKKNFRAVSRVIYAEVRKKKPLRLKCDFEKLTELMRIPLSVLEGFPPKETGAEKTARASEGNVNFPEGIGVGVGAGAGAGAGATQSHVGSRWPMGQGNERPKSHEETEAVVFRDLETPSLRIEFTAALDLPQRPQHILGFLTSSSTLFLTKLDLSRVNLRSIAESIFLSPYLRNIYSLKLQGAFLGREGFSALGRSQTFSSLRILNLAETRMTPTDGKLFEDASYLENIISLDLSGNINLRGAVASLIRSRRLKKLADLQIRNVGLGSEHAATFLSSLQYSVPFEQGGDVAVATNRELLPHNPREDQNVLNLPALTALDISRNPIESAAFRALIHSESLQGLLSLQVRKCKIGFNHLQATLQSLQTTTTLRNLTDLDLSNNPLGYEGLQTLSKLASEPSLTRLNYSYTKKGMLGTRGDAAHIDAAVNAFLMAPFLQNLIELDLKGAYLTRNSLGLLAASPNLRNLRRLSIESPSYPTTDRAASRTIHSVPNAQGEEEIIGYTLDRTRRTRLPFFEAAGIVSLNLSSVELSSDSFKNLAGSPFISLEALWLESNPMSLEDMRVLLRAPFFQSLQFLNMSHCGLRDEHMSAFSEVTSPTSLHTLILALNEVGDKGIDILSLSRFFRNLSTIDLRDNPCARGVPCLIQNGNLPYLKTLRASQVELQDVQLRLMVDSPYIRSLRVLELSNNNLTSEGMWYLANSRYSKNLETLDLFRNQIESDGVIYLSRSSSLINLTNLNIASNGVGVRGIDALSQCNNRLTQLVSLNLMGNNFSEKGVLAYILDSHAFSPSHLINTPAFLFQKAFGLLSPESPAIRALTQSLNFKGLRILDLGYNNLDIEVLTLLEGSGVFPSLIQLCLHNNTQISEISAIISPLVRNLRTRIGWVLVNP